MPKEPEIEQCFESVEVNSDFFKALEERSAACVSTSSKSSTTTYRKGVKTRFANILRPRLNRGTSNPSTPDSRCRTQSTNSAPPGLVEASPSRDKKSTSRQQPGSPRRQNIGSPRRQNIGSPNTGSSQQKHARMSAPQPPPEDDCISCSDNMTDGGVDGTQRSLATQTVCSVETVKVSNKATLSPVAEDAKTPWNKIIRVLKPFKPSSPAESEDTKMLTKTNRRRVQSYDKGASKNNAETTFSFLFANPMLERSSSIDSNQSSLKKLELAALDMSVRGHFDGVDAMRLGSVLWQTSNTDSDEPSHLFPWDDTRYTVAGRSTRYSPADLVKEMLWTSSGRAKPEMILDGFIPGPEDRWSVQIENLPNVNFAFTCAPESSGPPLLQAVSTDENTSSTGTDDHDSPTMCSHKLWTSLWGSDPMPGGQPNRDLLIQVGCHTGEKDARKIQNSDANDMIIDDPLLSLAACKSIPIDIDEDTFIVSTRDHLMSIQDIAAVPLSEGRFDTALRILEKLISGLETNVTDERKYIRGTTYHNIGLIHLWQGNYTQAHSALSEALKERKKNLRYHIDVVVTISRLSQSLFALERFDEAATVLEECLTLVGEDTVVLAKVLNNLAIVYYHEQEVSKALRYLTQALEAQRQCLDAPIRREHIVYDTAITLSNMGKLCLAETNFELCCSVYEEALLLQTSIFKKDHPLVMQAYVNLAWAKALAGHSRTALRLLESCHRVQTMHFGPDAAATVETEGWMAHFHARVEQYNEALPIYQRIREWQNQHLATNSTVFFSLGHPHEIHPAVHLVEDCIKNIEDASGGSLTLWI